MGCVRPGDGLISCQQGHSLIGGHTGETYCVGGGAERNGIELAQTILAALDLPEDMITYVADRPGHDRRYAIDANKIERDLGWKPSVNFEASKPPSAGTATTRPGGDPSRRRPKIVTWDRRK
jgi:hypothetical protein